MAAGTLTAGEESQLAQTIEMFEVITQSQPNDYQSLEILKEAYAKLAREEEVIKISKRIAKAYVEMGQLSSAILEYESILQRYPDDPDVLAALDEIESKANSLGSQASSDTTEVLTSAPAPATAAKPKATESRPIPTDVEDGRPQMLKIFVEAKILTNADFEICWPKPDFTTTPDQPVEPFIQGLADKGILPIEKSLKMLSDKSRLGYLPLDKYDVDFDFARTFPIATCLRWCVLPFDRMSKSVLVATCNPFNRQATNEIEQATKQRLLWYLAPPEDLIKALKKAFH